MDRTSAIFERATADLKERLGVGLSDLTAEETVALVKACMKVADPYSEVNADAAGFPVRVCEGVWFWRLTVGASIWLDRVDEILGGNRYDPRYKLALVYACRYARQAAMFFDPEDAKTLKRSVMEGLKDLDATPQEVDSALDVVLGIRPRKTSSVEIERAAVDWSALCSRLETQTGIPSSEWVWKRSGSYLVKCYNDLNAFARAHSMSGGCSCERMLDELDDAVNRLQVLKVNIAKRINGNG